MSSASPTGPEDVVWGLRRETWLKIALVAGVMTLLFWPNLRRLWLKTNPFTGEANWGHSMIIPIIGLYYLYLNREELLKAPVNTAWSGLPILLSGLLLYAYGIWPGQNDFVKDFGMVVALFGVVATLCGWSVMKVAWFPIAFLVCGIPWPPLVYSMVAGPLQELAAYVAVKTLSLTGVSAAQGGTKIFIGGITTPLRTLNVAEACAGLRSLMTFISVAAAIAFLSSRPLWQKLIITASAIPIAIFCNTMRVAGQGLLDTYVSQKLAEGFAHQFVGLVMLIPAFFLILLVVWILDHLFIEEVADKRVLVSGGSTDPGVLTRLPAMESANGGGAASVGTPAASSSRPAALPPRPEGILTRKPRTPRRGA